MRPVMSNTPERNYPRPCSTDGPVGVNGAIFDAQIRDHAKHGLRARVYPCDGFPSVSLRQNLMLCRCRLYPLHVWVPTLVRRSILVPYNLAARFHPALSRTELMYIKIGCSMFLTYVAPRLLRLVILINVDLLNAAHILNKPISIDQQILVHISSVAYWLF